MRGPQDRRFTVQFVRGRKRYYGPDGREIRAGKMRGLDTEGALSQLIRVCSMIHKAIGSCSPVLDNLPFRQVWAADFEFATAPGERLEPVCMVARELRSGQLVRLWATELASRRPYPLTSDSLFVAFFASAELGCHLSLDWPMPARILDLFVEFRLMTNGRATPAGLSLLGALAAFGLDSMGADEKGEMRRLILRGGPWSEGERTAILDYCQSDVDALVRLLPAMLPHILKRAPDPTVALGQALLRGRYMAAVAQMERVGTPIDAALWRRLTARWDGIKGFLVEEIDRDFTVYRQGSFSSELFAEYLSRNQIPWPRLDSGALDLKDGTFREMARAHPQIAPLHELRHTLSQLRLNELAVGSDNRNRCLLSPFRSRTGRNQPSNARFIFGPSTWLRGLIRPSPGCGIAYVDFASQEVGIAGALSRDPALMAAYVSGDVYLSFAKQARLVPPEATKATHGAVRDACKALVLGIGYGMGEDSLAARLGQPKIVARDLLKLHKATYPRFWRWSQAVIDRAILYGSVSTAFGWTLHTAAEANPRSLMNFPMQANGAEMLRLACCYATEAGLSICAPVHDAILLEAPLDRLDEDVARLRFCMAQASRDVLDGFEIRTEAKCVRWPGHYTDPRGAVMWERIMGLLDRLEREAA